MKSAPQHHGRFFLALLAGLAIAGSPGTADAQILKKLKKTVTDAAEQEALGQADRIVRTTIRCVFDDPICIEEAQASGEDMVLVDDGGEVIMDEEGAPVSDPEVAAEIVEESAPRPGEGLWANYDFVPGDRILFYDDFTKDRVGDFPRRLEFIEGTWEIVERGNERYLRATSAGIVKIPLPETLPDRFTVEFTVNTTHGNSSIWMTTGPAFYGRDRSYKGSAAAVRSTQAGLQAVGDVGPVSMTLYEQDLLQAFRNEGSVMPLRFMIDGDYVKIYLDENRVANVPNAVFPRTDALYIAATSVTPEKPGLIGPIRIAAGGRDLYDRLEADGRVATRGILFAVNSARIRPESTPTLQEIGEMLQEHPDLRLAIEGHTDSDGDEAYNQTLSEERANAVREFLIEAYGVDPSRLEAAGFGESSPVASNDTPEGKQQNRRVELVRLDGADS